MDAGRFGGSGRRCGGEVFQAVKQPRRLVDLRWVARVHGQGDLIAVRLPFFLPTRLSVFSLATFDDW